MSGNHGSGETEKILSGVEQRGWMIGISKSLTQQCVEVYYGRKLKA